MATHTRPFVMTGAALASAAAIVAATPVIAPNVTVPSPAALSAAKVQLTTFADVFTIPASEWIAAYFQGYGGVLGPTGTPPNTTPNTYAPGCENNCYVQGISGITYLLGDALINGNGGGWNESDQWATSAINYFYEGAAFPNSAGISPGLQYLAQTAIGSANPILSTVISLAFAGPVIVRQLWTTGWQLAATLVNAVPLVGPYIAGGIYAYLGVGPTGQANGYTQGLSGVLNYIIDLATGSPTPYPGALQSPAAALAAAVAAPAAAVQSSVSRAASQSSAVEAAAPSVAALSPRAASSASDAVSENKTEISASDATETKSAETVSTKPAETESTDSTEAPKPVDSPSSAVSDSASSAPAATKPADTTSKARKRPVRDAVEKVSKQIGSALGGAAKAATGSSAVSGR